MKLSVIYDILIEQTGKNIVREHLKHNTWWHSALYSLLCSIMFLFKNI